MNSSNNQSKNSSVRTVRNNSNIFESFNIINQII